MHAYAYEISDCIIREYYTYTSFRYFRARVLPSCKPVEVRIHRYKDNRKKRSLTRACINKRPARYSLTRGVLSSKDGSVKIDSSGSNCAYVLSMICLNLQNLCCWGWNYNFSWLAMTTFDVARFICLKICALITTMCIGVYKAIVWLAEHSNQPNDPSGSFTPGE